MEQYRDQPAHAEKIAYQQKLLQEDVVHIRAEISQVSTVRHTLHSQVHYNCNEKCSFFDHYNVYCASSCVVHLVLTSETDIDLDCAESVFCYILPFYVFIG